MKLIKLALFIAVLVFLLSGCSNNNAVPSDEPKTEIIPVIVIEHNLTNKSDDKPVEKIPAKQCVLDSDCAGAGAPVADGYSCWQRQLKARFNETKCLTGRCEIVQYESFIEICTDLQVCDSKIGACVQQPHCFDRDGKNQYQASQVTDGLGGEYKDKCDTSRSVIEFFCSPEFPEKIFNDTIACNAGCFQGACKNEDNFVVLNENSTQ